MTPFQKNDFYISGGETFEARGWFGGESWALTANVEIYNVVSNTWTQGPELMTPRKHHSSCSLILKLFVLGGIGEEDKLLSSVEMLDTSYQTSQIVQLQGWQPLDLPLFTPRTDPAVCAISDTEFVVLGGNDGEVDLNDALVYDDAKRCFNQVCES